MKKCLLTLLTIVFPWLVWAASTQDYVPQSNACYRHGYTELTTMEKRMYDYMLSEFLKFENNASTYSDVLAHRVYFDFAGQGITFNNQNDVTRMLTLLYRDVPELYIIYSPVYRYDYTLYKYYGRVPKLNTPESYLRELQLCDSAYHEISKSITSGMSEYEKALILHDAFIDWADYGGMASANSGNIKGSFIDKKAVCEGFSRAYLYLCQRVGLKCIYVCGSMKISDEPETWGNHAWNYVQIDGNWYLVDITADGGFPGHCGHIGFLRGLEYYNAGYRLTNVDGGDENVNQYTYKALPTLSATDYTVPTEISNAPAATQAHLVAVYNLAGQRLAQPQSGINLLRYSDGSVKKVIY